MGTKNDTVITPDPITAELEPFAPAVMETARRAHKCKACDENRHNLRIATRFVTSATGSARHNVGRDAAERVPLIALRRQR